jgi:hypothetical protein
MKGQSQLLWWLLIIAIVSAASLGIFWPSVFSSVSDAVRLSGRYQALELGGIINEMQAAPDGMEYMWAIPKGGGGCVSIYHNSVEVKRSSMPLVERNQFNASLALLTEPLVINCTGGMLVMRKSNGVIKFVIEQV